MKKINIFDIFIVAFTIIVSSYTIIDSINGKEQAKVISEMKGEIENLEYQVKILSEIKVDEVIIEYKERQQDTKSIEK